MNTWQLGEAVRTLDAGGIIAYPTEAVYGLGCNPLDARAVMRLLDLKHRPLDSGLILVAARFSQLQPYLGSLPSKQRKQVRSSWPGPFTWLWPARPEVPDWLRGTHDTLAVRVSDHPIVSALCERWEGAIVSTSANPHGLRPARTPLRVRKYFADAVDFILHGPLGGQIRPTQIRRAVDGRTVRH